MHEHLIPGKHPKCVQEIINLKQCQEENGLWRMFGLCNEAKHSLDVCFKRERSERRYESNMKGRESRKRWEAVMAEMEDDGTRFKEAVASGSTPPTTPEAPAQTSPAPAERLV